ncbi:hypothetical protein MHO82_12945 [Vibrio sp. Of7-15]|uniref:hypothetical protein n=1 Tax=Vibrio sp. Of7-15 TaxID=2724879 RepID=UPI001EF39FAC|nr:hypothetical protein [Vibrio sp. Of7-15]MCG7497771.1 hypothetical protein [Vibrio sp. Of7-15]
MKKLAVLALAMCSIDAVAFSQNTGAHLGNYEYHHIEKPNVLAGDNLIVSSKYNSFTSSQSRNQYLGVRDPSEFLWTQLGIGLFSGAAAFAPEFMGWSYILTSPLITETLPPASRITATAGLASVGAYNLYLADEDESEGDIFIANLIGLNAVWLSSWASDQIFYDESSSFSLAPDGNGGWYMNFRYTF